MAHTPSPLRYPGGKTSIKNMVSAIIKENHLAHGHYIEPYAGGCGLALSLLFDGHMHELHLNDVDRSIYAFWYSVLNSSKDLIEMIESKDITMDEWYKQREIQDNKSEADLLTLGFSTLFLNRTNRSGIIIKAGVIGGKDQNGKYKLDCRFTKDALIKKIQKIAKYSHRIHFTNMDAIDFMKVKDHDLDSSAFFCIDPPYFNKGSALYTNSYDPGDHEEVAETVLNLNNPWILTYDNAPQIRELYASRQQSCFYLNYSAATKRVASELLVNSDNIVLPSMACLSKVA